MNDGNDNYETIRKKGMTTIANNRKCIVVRVGYGWQKFDGENCTHGGREVLYDTFWRTLKKMFQHSCDGFQNSKNSNGISVSLRRLRASHGHFVWASVEQRIAESDILIFDVADAPKGDISGKSGDLAQFIKQFNANVLLEIGYAIGCKKRILLMCPKHLFTKVPTDLRGFLWTLYTGHINDGQLTRELVDSFGTINAFRGMLREIASTKDGIEREE